MADFVNIKNSVCVFAGMVGAVLSSLFGGFGTDLKTLIILLMIDYITGVIVAVVFCNSNKTENGGASSTIGWRGIFKKVATLFVVMLAYRIDLTLGTNYIKSGVTVAYICNEAISITENVGLMGVPLPNVVVKAIELLKKDKNDADK